jgi:uncharacterized protein YkwD
MARQDKLAHVLNGRGAEDRLHKAGYTGSAWAENIAAGERTPSGAIDMWMNSEVHRGNILHPPYNQVGIGIAKNGEGVTFYTVLFGSSSAQ